MLHRDCSTSVPVGQDVRSDATSWKRVKKAASRPNKRQLTKKQRRKQINRKRNVRKSISASAKFCLKYPEISRLAKRDCMPFSKNLSRTQRIICIYSPHPPGAEWKTSSVTRVLICFSSNQPLEGTAKFSMNNFLEVEV